MEPRGGTGRGRTASWLLEVDAPVQHTRKLNGGAVMPHQVKQLGKDEMVTKSSYKLEMYALYTIPVTETSSSAIAERPCCRVG